MERKLREEKEQAWEKELETAMNLSEPITGSPPKDVSSHCSSKSQDSNSHLTESEIADSSNEPKTKSTSCSGQLLKIPEKDENEVADEQKLQNIDYIDRTPSPSDRVAKNQ